MTTQKVETKQVYEDLDYRRGNRTFRIEAVLSSGHALVKPLTGGTKMTKIKLDRFKPWKYRLVGGGNLSNGTTATTKVAPRAINSNAVVAAAKSVGLATPLPLTNTNSLVDRCKAVLPGSWRSDWANVATLSQGCLGLVVRSVNDLTYDVKVQLDGLIVDTWSTKHLDLSTVLSYLKTKLETMRNDFSAALD